MSDLTVNATDIKCRVYVAKFLCAQCLCLHGKLLFLCVRWNQHFFLNWWGIVYVLAVPYGTPLENVLFGYKSCTYKSWCFFSSTFFSTRSLWMQMFTYISLYCLNSTAGLPAVQLLSVSHILFPFFHSQSFFFLYILTYFRFTHFIHND